MSIPIPMRWDGEAFAPLPRFAKEADRQFVIGEVYRLAPVEERSMASHGHFFACVHDAWANLPEHLAPMFPTETHLRKWALVRAGYADHRSIVAASKAEAQRIAAFVKPMDEFAVVSVKEATVNVWTAQSQSMKAMGKKAFQDSKTKVIEILDDMVGVDRGALAKNAGQAA